MRLLDTDRLEVVLIREDVIPPYAILSHTWGNDEVSLQDMHSLGVKDAPKSIPRLKRVVDAAKLIASDCYRWMRSRIICTMGNDEASLKEMHSFSGKDAPRNMPSRRKIIDAAKLAASDGYRWIWIDTCCIDRTSSAELSEAINSMYRWYENAGVCYVYLQDEPDGLYEVGIKKTNYTA
ncbi:hypothetical protein Daus18300_003334 [Diaporthe australafricana]|uniref:Heterokaryon incompatibility domain-containing protein n=1 Tax=Diaporthe australafricana TaxID=127596 RepID=A0ABR3XI32_9PEZI